MTMDSLKELRDYIDGIIYSESLHKDRITNGFLDELIYYYILCNNYLNEYKNIRIIYGIDI